MPNLRLAIAARVTPNRAKQPTRLERIRSSLSIWQIAIAIASVLVAITLAGVVTYRHKNRTDDEGGEADSTSTGGEAASTPTGGEADATPTSGEADSTSAASGNDAAPGADTAPGNENALADTVQKEMFHQATGPN